MSPVRHEFVHNPLFSRNARAFCPVLRPRPIWDQFQALIPPVVDTHPYGGHRPRVADRFGFALPEITMHPDAVTTPARPVNLSPVSAATLISTKGTAHQAGARWVVERTTQRA